MLRLRGTAHHFDQPLVGTVTRLTEGAGSHQFLVVDAGDTYPAKYAYGAVLTASPSLPAAWTGPGLTHLLNLDQLAEGDIVSLQPTGQLIRQYQVDSTQNFLLATERCNSNCLMCARSRQRTAMIRAIC
jgi:hypothetical protein